MLAQQIVSSLVHGIDTRKGLWVNNNLVVAMASRLIHIYDIRKMNAPAESSGEREQFEVHDEIAGLHGK